MYALVRFSVWILGLYKLEAFVMLMGFLEYSVQIAAKLLCSCHCLFDTIHAMNFSLESESEILCVINAHLIHDLYFSYIAEAFITLN